MQFNISCFWISAYTPSVLQYQNYFIISKWTSRLKEWTWKRMIPSLGDDDTHWNLLAFGKLNLYIPWKNKLRKMAISHHFSQHFNNYAQTVELLHVFWCFLFLLSSFLWACHIVCDKFFILQPQLFIYVFFPPNLYPLWLQTNFVCIWYCTSHCSLFFSSAQFPLASLFTLCSFFPFLSLFCMGFFLLPLFFQLDFPVGGLQASFRNIIGTSCSVIFHWK